MTDRELFDRIQATMTELERLIEAADQNSKYHTKGVLLRAYRQMADAAVGLSWHAEDR